MQPEIITGLDGVMYKGYPFIKHGPWNQLLHCPGNSCHVHYGHGTYHIKQLPSDPHAYYHYLGPLVPNVTGLTTAFHAHSRENIVTLIEKAIDGEYSAISCYQHLINLASTQYIKDKINEIRKDEIRHFNSFSNLYTQLTGEKYKPKISEECPKKYKQGLYFAFKDEQETVDFYLEIVSKTDNPKIKEEFQRAAHDEQNHAVWFLYFLK